MLQIHVHAPSHKRATGRSAPTGVGVVIVARAQSAAVRREGAAGMVFRARKNLCRNIARLSDRNLRLRLWTRTGVSRNSVVPQSRLIQLQSLLKHLCDRLIAELCMNITSSIAWRESDFSELKHKELFHGNDRTTRRVHTILFHSARNRC